MAKSKIIGFVNTSQSWGGGEKWHFEAARDLKLRGFNVVFFCSPGSAIEEKIRSLNVPIEPLKVSNLSFLNPIKMIRLCLTLKRRGITTLLINNPADLKLVGPAARCASISNIIFRRGVPRPFKRNFYNRWLLRDVIHWAIANSNALADTLNEAKGIGMVPTEKLVLIENGIQFDKIETMPPLVEKDDRITLSTAGRMINQKNQAFLIDVARDLRDQGLDFRLLIAGSGELENALRDQVKSYQLEPQIEFLGFVENVPALFAATDIFVFPSFYEGSPNALIEAAGYGLPIVASDIPPIREILPDDSVGRLCPVNNAQEFCDAITDLTNSPDKRRELGQAARKVIQKRFDLDNAREKLIALLA